MTKQLQQKTTKFLYERSINHSSRKKLFPRNDSEITLPYTIDTVNLGIEVYENRWFIRVKFDGSAKFFDCNIEFDRIAFWGEYMVSLHREKPDIYELCDSEDQTQSIGYGISDADYDEDD